MSEIPAARVVRGGDEGGSQAAGAVVTPDGPVLRLAPRVLPRALVWRLWFGGWIATFGWGFATFGMVFVLVFLPMVDVTLGSYDRQASATLTDVHETSSTENERRIYRVSYTFVDEAGVERRGESYTVDPPAALEAWPVEYQSGDPSVSRLEGLRRRPFSPFALFVIVFPLIGLGICVGRLPGVLRNLRLLRYGAETRGRLVRKRETRVYVNGAPLMALTFQYEVDGKPYTATVKTLTTGPLEDDEREPMLYDPRAPWRATTLDHLPGSLKVTAGGELEARPGVAIHLLILPLLFAGLVAAAAIRLI